jgi:polyhydroxyalkanoate synthesis regulator phasin
VSAPVRPTAARAAHEELIPVVLLDLPVAIWERADDEARDLMRELAVIALNRDREVADVPSQLTDLIDELERDYGAISHDQARRLVQAQAARELVIDRLEYRLPRRAADDIRRLAEALDAADEYCQQGEHLLSVASSPVAKAFRDWFLGELATQLAGGEPTPWPLSRYAAVVGEVVEQ